MSRIKNFFSGQVTFSVTDFPVAGLNRLRQYAVRNLCRKDNVFTFTVPLIHAAAVKKLVANFDWQMQENANIFRGINYLLNHFILCITVLLGLGAFLVLDMGIYRVQVNATDDDVVTAVYEHLQSVGVKRFMWKNQVASLDLANNLVATFPSVAHAHVRVAGNTLVVDLATAANHQTKQKIDVYAKYDAVIKDVVAYTGQVMVSVGDVVRKGDLLVQGAYADSVAITGEVAFIYDDKIVRLDIAII